MKELVRSFAKISIDYEAVKFYFNRVKQLTNNLTGFKKSIEDCIEVIDL